MSRTLDALNWATKEMPTGAAQAALSRTYNQMRMAGESDNTIVRMMAAAVIDGLAYGNWPGLTNEECQQLAEIRRKRTAPG